MITVFPAKSIITMNASMPRAEAVAVRDGKILETGTLESLKPWLSKHDHEIDEQFKNSFIVPGLIDPHLHPSMAAVLLPTYLYNCNGVEDAMGHNASVPGRRLNMMNV